MKNTDGDSALMIVSSLYSCCVFDTTSANTVLGWNLFVAAMTPNSTLRSDLIMGIHDRVSFYGNQSIGAFPVRYGVEGHDISGIGR